MGIIKAYASLIIGLIIGVTITLYFNLDIFWGAVNGFVTMTLVLWIEDRIRKYRAERVWQKYLRENR